MTDPNFLEPEWETPPGAPLKGVRLAAAAGAQELGVTLYELAPGSAISPYHVHHGNEELLLVLSGRPLVRTPDGTRRVAPGTVMAFPRGADGAHRVANPERSGDEASGRGRCEPARVLLISTMNTPDLAEHLSTGAMLAMTEHGGGKVFPQGADQPIMDALDAAMALDAEADQRSLSTS